MKTLRAAKLAALFLLLSSGFCLGQDVTLTSRDGDVEISGNLLGFDGEFYRVDTIYGELTVDGSGVLCAGPGCPDIEDFIARATFSGAPSIGRVLMPALIEAFAIRNSYQVSRENLAGGHFRLLVSDVEEQRVLGEFTFRLTNTDEGFADLLANEADFAMSVREVSESEIRRARDAGLGTLSGRAGSRVIALDALVPLVAPSNPVQSVTLQQLSGALAGEISNWQELGGPDAPVAIHLQSGRTGVGQATETALAKRAGRNLAGHVVRHPNGPQLAAAVSGDPFALGVTSRSEAGDAWELALKGECGFEMRATRRSIKTEDYPLTSPLFLYLPARRFPKLIREFMIYLSDPSAQLVIRRAGFVDQAAEEISINEQGDRFANAISQAGQETDLLELQRMVRVLAPLKRLTTTFRFEAGSSRLDAQSRSNVRQLARAMELGLYDSRRLVFVGFSDGDGSAVANREIAKRRATAVRDAVASEAETADLSRIGLAIEAFGEAMPMACDDSAWGRQINRRVEVWVR